MPAAWYFWENDRLYLRIRIQPKASRTGFAGPLGDELKIRVTAPPVDGEANQCLIEFLAKACRVAKGNVELVSGLNARSKLVGILRPVRLPEGVEPASD